MDIVKDINKDINKDIHLDIFKVFIEWLLLKEKNTNEFASKNTDFAHSVAIKYTKIIDGHTDLFHESFRFAMTCKQSYKLWKDNEIGLTSELLNICRFIRYIGYSKSVLTRYRSEIVYSKDVTLNICIYQCPKRNFAKIWKVYYNKNMMKSYTELLCIAVKKAYYINHIALYNATNDKRCIIYGLSGDILNENIPLLTYKENMTFIM